MRSNSKLQRAKSPNRGKASRKEKKTRKAKTERKAADTPSPGLPTAPTVSSGRNAVEEGVPSAGVAVVEERQTQSDALGQRQAAV